MYYPIAIRLSGAASATDEAVVALHERVEVQGAYVVDAAGIAHNNTNYAEFKVLGNDQATAIYLWSTQTGEEESLTADTPAELVDQKQAALSIFDAGEAIVLQLAKGGSIAADATLILNCRQARNY